MLTLQSSHAFAMNLFASLNFSLLTATSVMNQTAFLQQPVDSDAKQPKPDASAFRLLNGLESLQGFSNH